MKDKKPFALWRTALAASAKRFASPPDESLEELEERLLLADLGPSLAADLVAAVAADKKTKNRQGNATALALGGGVAGKTASCNGGFAPAAPSPTGDSAGSVADRSQWQWQDHHHGKARPSIPSPRRICADCRL